MVSYEKPDIGVFRYDTKIHWDTANEFRMLYLQNRSGQSVTTGDIVVWDKANPNSFKLTTTEDDVNVCGVIAQALDADGNATTQKIANLEWGWVQTARRCPKVKLTTVAAVGHFIQTSTTAGKGKSSSDAKPGSFAIALTSGTEVECLLGFISPSRIGLNINAGLLYTDTAGNKVGIGTTSPGARLSVSGIRSSTVSTTTAVSKIGGDDVHLYTNAMDSGPWSVWMQVLNDAGDPLPLVLNPSGGKVGIGTMSPGAGLDVITTDTGRQLKTYDWADMSSSASGYGLFGGNMYQDWSPAAFKYSNTHGSIGAMGFAVNYPAWNKASVITSGTTSSTADTSFTPIAIVTFQYDGNVGIRTMNPEQTLDIEGTAQLRRVADADATNTKRASNVLQFQGAYWDGTGSIEAYGRMLLTVVDPSIPRYELEFTVGTVVGLVINDIGYLGIRNPAPSNILTVEQFSATDPIADAWTTYSTRDVKEVIPSDKSYLVDFLAFPCRSWKRKLVAPRKDDFKTKEAFQKAQEEFKHKRSLPKFSEVHLGLIAEEAPEFLKAYDQNKKLVGIDLSAYVGWLHAVLAELVTLLRDKAVI